MKSKLPPEVWEWITGIIVMDDDGWNHGVEAIPNWNTPITKEEFLQKCGVSTCQYPPNFFEQYMKK